jgi:hypothetical protein
VCPGNGAEALVSSEVRWTFEEGTALELRAPGW